MKKFLILLLVAVISMLSFGCNNLETAETEKILESSTSTSESMIESSETEATSESLKKSVAVGDTITFGNLTWRVLAVNGTKALLITKDIVADKHYNDTCTDVTWETCTLRSWLNSTFLTTYIPSSTDRAKIITTTVVNDDNPEYGTEGGNTTYDKVFLLSIAEANAYFSSNSDRVAYEDGDEFWWWLRSPGHISSIAAIVESDGSVFDYGIYVSNPYGVRPALWVDLSK